MESFTMEKLILQRCIFEFETFFEIRQNCKKSITFNFNTTEYKKNSSKYDNRKIEAVGKMIFFSCLVKWQGF